MIDPDIERAGLEMSARLGQQVRDMIKEAGFTEKEVDKIMFDAMDGIIVCGRSLHSFEDRLFFWVKQNDINGLS